MLRYLFEEPRRQDEGILREAMEALNQYLRKLERGVLDERRASRSSQQTEETEKLVRSVIIKAGGFIRALDELEQSIYAAGQFSRRVRRRFIEEMDLEELDHYHRYLYFYKNALLRIFSTLDKLGYFLDEQLKLETEKIKQRFSYFTVLRRMHQRRPDLQMDNQLYQIKESFQASMTILRKQRNTETHFMNTELVDDLLQAKMELFPPGKTAVESLEDNLQTLNQGYEMVCRSLTAAFAGLSHEFQRSGRHR
ncbi:Cthe_2314 family HEPN domain-containing protein [Paenibacillus sp. J2TS4]|uniref:Cthe_2314 family HEPN domain-containing protein n=1 Tax=Paenibacillus sp. J2TS4 TaxID=2807194 RepID=UPI001B060F05|nr:Cthe_2314 family HEPN domain-containing protein [Paenibacillus sp. J2TS4]GIP31170.1 hypothetical protein J2TS4_03800 [Paenibacillus sp. J2TS4]